MDESSRAQLAPDDRGADLPTYDETVLIGMVDGDLQLEVAGHRVGPSLQRLLIHRPPAGAEVGSRTQLGPLPSLEIHDVVTHGAAP